LEDIQKNIRELDLDDNRKKELACALHAQFKDWLYGKFSYIDITVMIE
jgi:TBCC domain-containing protein 1